MVPNAQGGVPWSKLVFGSFWRDFLKRRESEDRTNGFEVQVLIVHISESLRLQGIKPCPPHTKEKYRKCN
jgi:hypothetical protein